MCSKYEQSRSFGCIISSLSNTVWTPDESPTETYGRNTGAGRVFVGANEEVLCWDVKKGELLGQWRDGDCTAAVTAIAQSRTDPDIFAVGYGDGSIRLWDSRIGSVLLNFDGHRSAITVLAFDGQGVRLASGSKDTDIIVWDLVTEAGLFKLRGHKDQITGLQFFNTSTHADVDGDLEAGDDEIGGITSDGFLLSTSKDALIKLWDVEAQYCIETHVTQSNGECWSLGVSPDGSGCITGGNDGEIKVWALDMASLRKVARRIDTENEARVLIERGTLNRQARDRTIGVSFHPKADYIAVHGSEKSVELWRIKSPAEIKRSLARKRRRRREKNAGGKEVNGDSEMVDGADEDDISSAAITEVFVPYITVRCGGKVRSIDWAGGRPSKALQLMVATTNNQVELYHVPVQEKSKKPTKDEHSDYNRPYALDLAGHRTDIRAISLSSDDRMLATASSGSLKIWNVRTGSCLRTLDCGYALCCAFLPGDKVVVLGNKSGELELFDIASSTLIETVKAHEGPIWTLQVHPDGRSVVTGSADKSAKFWNFEIVQEEIPGTRRTAPRLKLVHTRTLKVNDDILNLCYSPNARLLAVATLDNTVKVFFVDSLKLFLNLYGHKLPVLNMSISYDSKLIVTCSADKNVRIWGLDFGDCHKAIFAHDESIMQVGFIPHPQNDDGHLFFSASKDHLLKSWDGDKFQQVQKLSGHHGEIWAMTVSQAGDFVVTASHDKGVRIWSQTDEPVFLEEERERELEEMHDRNLTTSLEKDQQDEYAAAEQEGDSVEVVAASKQTTTTLTSGEKIIEALTLCTEDLATMQDFEAQKARNPSIKAVPQRHPILAFRNVSAEKYLLSVFEAIPSPALHDALLLLSFSTIAPLFTFLSLWLDKEMNVPLTCRILFFLLKTHHKQVVASRELKAQLQDMKKRLEMCLGKWKDVLGFNMAATRILGERAVGVKVRRIEDEEVVKSGKKRAFVNVA